MKIHTATGRKAGNSMNRWKIEKITRHPKLGAHNQMITQPQNKLTSSQH
jgi:hypothetical protein